VEDEYTLIPDISMSSEKISSGLIIKIADQAEP
jgi:hypothetical protein